jgi:predicted DNA-binding antitoxin AbrB/MazE fold protein
MPMRIEAIYEGGVLKPRTPLPIPEHTHVQVEVTPAEMPTAERPRLPTLPRDVWEQALGSVALGGDALVDSEAYYDAS